MKVLLPIDGSELSLEAVRYVVRMRKDGLSLTAVLANVQEPAHLYELLMAHDPDAIDRACAEAGLHALTHARTTLDNAGIEYECEVAKGDPAHTIVEISERFGCDMIAMGARGTSALRSAMLGSVSNEVLHASGMPVVIVKVAEPVLEAD
jgi:nucleotide-binding universal stress UspA family protein